MAITRDEILRRARAVPLGSIPYSQGGTNASGPAKGYRRDCSGFVSYCWALPTSGPGSWGGYSTATFVTQGLIVPIPRAELEPGDAIGYCGPTTAASGGGHIALWLGKSGTREHIIDHGSGMGPKDRIVTWGTGTGWQAVGKLGAWRYVGIGGGVPSSIVEGSDMAILARHGDGGEPVEVLQQQILAAGGALPKWGADGGYGDETAAALKALIGGGDGRVYDAGDRALLLVLADRRQSTPLEPVVDVAAIAAEVAGKLRITVEPAAEK